MNVQPNDPFATAIPAVAFYIEQLGLICDMKDREYDELREENDRLKNSIERQTRDYIKAFQAHRRLSEQVSWLEKENARLRDRLVVCAG